MDVLHLYEIGSLQINQLQDQLLKHQRFQQMVIHDMRSPTVAIKSGQKATLHVIFEAKQIVGQDQSDFVEQCKRLHSQVQQKSAAVQAANALVDKALASTKDIEIRVADLNTLVQAARAKKHR